MVDSKDQIVSLQADLKDKGRNFNRMLIKERIMAMFDLMFDEQTLNKYQNIFFEIIKKSGALDPADIAKLQTMGFLFDSNKINNIVAAIRERCGTTLSNHFITRAFFVEILHTAKEQMKEYDVTRNADIAVLDTTINSLADDKAIFDNLDTFKKSAMVIHDQWYNKKAGIDQARFAKEKSMHVRVNYFVREGIDVPEPLKQEFVDYIRAHNPAANIKKVTDINWEQVKADKKITAPVVSVREINNTAKPTTLVRATDIGVTQMELLQVLNSDEKFIRLPGNPCNEKPNPFFRMDFQGKDGKTYAIRGVLEADGLVHFKKAEVIKNGDNREFGPVQNLTKFDVAQTIVGQENMSVKAAIPQCFSKFAYFDRGVDLNNEAEFGQEIEIPEATSSMIETASIPEPTAQTGEPGDNSDQQPELEFMASNQLFLEDAKPEMVQENTQSTIIPTQPNNNDTLKNRPSSIPGEPIPNTTPDIDINIPPLNDLPQFEGVGINMPNTAFHETKRDTTGSAATRKGEPEENLLPIQTQHTDPGDSAVANKVAEPSSPSPKISAEIEPITMAGDALEQKPQESAHFSYNLILHDNEFRVLIMSRATALTRSNGISAVSESDRDAWIQDALNSSEFPQKDKTEIKEMKDKVDNLKSQLKNDGDNQKLKDALKETEKKLSEAVQFFIFDQKLVGNTFIEIKTGTKVEYKPCESIHAFDKDNTVIYLEKNDKGQPNFPSMRPDPSELKTISVQKTAYHEYEILKTFSDDVSQSFGTSLKAIKTPSTEQKTFYLAIACIKTYKKYLQEKIFESGDSTFASKICSNVARKGYDMVSQLNEKTAQHFKVPQGEVNALKESLKEIDPTGRYAPKPARSTSPERQAVTEVKEQFTNKVNDPKKSPPTPTNKF